MELPCSVDQVKQSDGNRLPERQESIWKITIEDCLCMTTLLETTCQCTTPHCPLVHSDAFLPKMTWPENQSPKKAACQSIALHCPLSFEEQRSFLSSSSQQGFSAAFSATLLSSFSFFIYLFPKALRKGPSKER